MLAQCALMTGIVRRGKRLAITFSSFLLGLLPLSRFQCFMFTPVSPAVQLTLFCSGTNTYFVTELVGYLRRPHKTLQICPCKEQHIPAQSTNNILYSLHYYYYSRKKGWWICSVMGYLRRQFIRRKTTARFNRK